LGIFYQNDKFYKIIKEYEKGNFIIGQNQTREQKFYWKYRKELFIHQNPNYKSILINGERLSYYFIDNVSVIEIKE